MNAIKRLPTLFIPHGGGPCFFMDPPAGSPYKWDGLAAYLRGIDGSLGVRPKAVLVISGHWENPLPTLNVAAKPGLLFDYYGFPEHTYRLKYPAAGAPDLAERCLRDYLASNAKSDAAPAFKVHLELGRLLVARGDSEDANREIEAAAVLAPAFARAARPAQGAG